MNLSMYFVSMNSKQLLLVLVMCTLVEISSCLPSNHLSWTHARKSFGIMERKSCILKRTTVRIGWEVKSTNILSVHLLELGLWWLASLGCSLVVNREVEDSLFVNAGFRGLRKVPKNSRSHLGVPELCVDRLQASSCLTPCRWSVTHGLTERAEVPRLTRRSMDLDAVS